MITITNDQITVPVHTEKLKADAHELLALLNYVDFDLGILLTNNATIQKFNSQFRKKDEITDILSFPYHADVTPEKRIEPKSPEDRNLGDILIAPEYVKETLAQWNQSFDERLQALLVHGICHLVGYDHETDEEYAIMKKQEESLLAQLKKHNK